MAILITGGAGFVGSSLAKQYRARFPDEKIVVFDNLKRRGSELNLPVFKKLDIEFVHGDIRIEHDLNALNRTFDLFVEASAEPSVHAGMDGDPNYLIQTNLLGTVNCLNFARKFCNQLVFLSTSRVYSIPEMRAMKLSETASRFVADHSSGINESFSVAGFKSLYGATKLASELLLQEYVEAYGMNAIINRCGVIAGPGQWGKVDQGVFTLWVANHYFNKNLSYTGFGGEGKQVRDLLHPEDLFSLIEKQRVNISQHKGEVFNVGGGISISTSLKELTQICQEITGNKIEIASQPNTAKVDIPYYVTDISKVMETYSWEPKRNVKMIVSDIYSWLRSNEEMVKQIFV